MHPLLGILYTGMQLPYPADLQCLLWQRFWNKAISGALVKTLHCHCTGLLQLWGLVQQSAFFQAPVREAREGALGPYSVFQAPLLHQCA